MVIITSCVNCKPHTFQDRVYAGKRVFNVNRKAEKKRCTVCGNVSNQAVGKK